ncbi:hypothetical protein AAIR98_000201 [Elusimicrobium simillimum]|uniref:lipoprotein N-acyltransferase Lnb domain-containing protein n=1 Tax=Elusimicrobium simillimum TaxID=3143438 RepID=UPI003C6FF4B5
MKSLKYVTKYAFIIFSVLFLASAAHANVQAAKTLAVQKRLSKNPYWAKLLHYNGNKSEVISQSFFISPKGMTDPAAELNATIDAIYSDKKENHPSCLFPLRTQWIKEQLMITDAPEPKCGQLEEYLKYTHPKSISLFYISPESFSFKNLFGHLGLRINRTEGASGDNTCCYVSNMETEATPVTVYRSVTGGHSGSFSMTSFDDIAKMFNIEQDRDIWEYDLNLTQEQVNKVVLHVWELRNAETRHSLLSLNGAQAVERILMVAVPDLAKSSILRDTPITMTKKLNEKGLIIGEAHHPRISKQTAAPAPQKPAKPKVELAPVTTDDQPTYNVYVPIEDQSP